MIDNPALRESKRNDFFSQSIGKAAGYAVKGPHQAISTIRLL